MTITYSDLSEIDGVAQKVIQACQGFNIWLFEGQMGAGKTTLIKSICAQMKVVDNVSLHFHC